ncbi:hypothetical protein H7992_22490 [Sporosarcina sp. resist]|uniref:SAR2788 family putative toxin n=1 Tax=Sporosarcina sp. resist TaxID=2762563 RepID=UPI00164D449C|nr:SAR2788 family putative toxin [Sporosarcina sp. resist]QNK87893.1 hypothetical protein H7992_22490 [Sporosarcina sp. resist]
MKSIYSSEKLIILIVIAMVFTLFPKYQVKAQEDLSSLISIENQLKEELKKDNIVLKNLDISTEELTIKTTLKTVDDNLAEATIEVTPGSNIMKLFTTEVDELGETLSAEYIIKINEFENDEFEATIVDLVTGEEFEYNSEEGTASFAFLIPIGIAMTPAILTALFHTGAMILVGGAAYVVANQAKRSKDYNHFAAVVQSGTVYHGGGLSKAQAVTRIKSGNDTWSTSSNQAKGVASSANPNGQPINEVDQLNGKPKKGYYYHWHPYKRTPKAHAFYGNPV